MKDRGIEVKIVRSNQALVAEVEMDEMWSFVSDKSHQCWLWWAIDHNTGIPLAYCFGTKEHKHLDELRSLLAPFRISIVYCDDNSAYKTHIVESIVNIGKRNTQRIERKHLSLRTWCSRLVRKGIRFSKSLIIHKIVIGLIINFWFFKRNLPFHLT
jgi:insertion element IS1 protein InsB